MARKFRRPGEVDYTDDNLLPYVREFLAYLKTELVPEDSQRQLRHSLIKFSDFCARQDIDHPADVTKATVAKYYSFLEQDPLVTEPLRLRFERALRKFYAWLEESDLIDVNPAPRKSSFKDSRKGLIHRAISEDEIENLIMTHKKEAFTKNPFYYQRRELVLTMGLVWGLSYGEMSGLNVSDMDVRQDVIVITKASGGVRTLPYHPEIKTAFQRYMTHRVRKRTFGGEDPLIVIADGTRMPPNEIYHMMRMLGEQAGVKLNSYVFKHTANHAMLEHGMSEEAIRKIFSRKRQHSLADLSKRTDKDGLLEEGRPALQNFGLLFRNSGELLREKNIPLK